MQGEVGGLFGGYRAQPQIVISSPQTEGLITIPSDTTNRLNLIGALYSPDYDRTVKEQDKLVGLVNDDRFDHESALNVFFRSDQFPSIRISTGCRRLGRVTVSDRTALRSPA